MGTLASSLDLSSDPIYLRKPCRDPPGGAFSFLTPHRKDRLMPGHYGKGMAMKKKVKAQKKKATAMKKTSARKKARRA